MSSGFVQLEICVFSISDAIIAMNSGADRIELCASYADGGITPSHAVIEKTFQQIDPAKVVVMIRPRGGNFIYDDAEFDVMKSDILHCKRLGAQQVIFGIINSNSGLDMIRNQQLVELAYPMKSVLQRAFDLTHDPQVAMENAIECGFSRILTSGQHPSAIEGKEIIRKLIVASGNKIEILPGAGIRSENALELIQYTGAQSIHASAKKYTDESADFRKGIYDFQNIFGVDAKEISALKEITGKILL